MLLVCLRLAGCRQHFAGRCSLNVVVVSVPDSCVCCLVLEPAGIVSHARALGGPCSVCCPRASPLILPPPPCALPAGGVCCCHLSPASPVTEHGKAPKAPVTGCTCTAVPTGQSPLAQGCLLSLPRIGWSTALHSLRKPCTVCSCQGHICLFSVLHHEKKKKKKV